MIIAIAIAAASLLAAQTLLVAILSALRPKGNIYITTMGVSIVTSPAAFLAGGILLGPEVTLEGRFYLALTHLSLGGFLFHFITLPDRSVTLRILVELWLAPGNTLSIDALKSRYSVPAMIQSRLEQLANGEFIAISPEQVITLRPKGQWFAGFVTGGRRLFRIKSAN